MSGPTSEQPGQRQVDADGLLRHLVRPDVEDVLAHVEVDGLFVGRLVIAQQQDFVALLKRKQQDLILRREEGGEQRQAKSDHSPLKMQLLLL